MFLGVLTLALALFGATAARAQTVGHYTTDPAGKSELKMEGTSTIHDWEVITAIISGSIDADAGFPESALKPDAAAPKPKVQLFIPVRSLKSQVTLGASTMDGVMRDHMEETKFKRIEYTLTDLKPKGATNGAVQFDAVGALTVHGVTNTLTMPVVIKRDGKKLIVTGAAPLKMSSFAIPPVEPKILGMPTIKTGDEVKISFTWAVVEKAP